MPAILIASELRPLADPETLQLPMLQVELGAALRPLAYTKSTKHKMLHKGLV